jgi:hypothetical protein
MWIFTVEGFFSIVCASRADRSVDPDLLMVRARRREHLRNLQRRFQELREFSVIVLPKRDYRCRLIIPKATWIAVSKKLAADLDYSNFKSAVAERSRGEGEYLRALHDVWSRMHCLQNVRRGQPAGRDT